GQVINRPTSITVTNSSGGLVAKTVNSYDGSSLVTSGATGILMHDDTNYSSSFTARGNLTQVQQYVTSSTYLTSSMTYDITGQMRTATDPAGNQTSFAYTQNEYYDDPGDGSTPTLHSFSGSSNSYLKTITY